MRGQPKAVLGSVHTVSTPPHTHTISKNSHYQDYVLFVYNKSKWVWIDNALISAWTVNQCGRRAAYSSIHYISGIITTLGSAASCPFIRAFGD